MTSSSQDPTPDEPLIIDITGGTTVVIGRDEDGRVTVSVADDDAAAYPSRAERQEPFVATPAGEPPTRVIKGRKAVRPTARRIRPGAWTPTDVALVLGCALSSALIVALLLHTLGSSPGWVADLALWYALTLVMVFVTTREQLDRLAAVDRVVTLVITTGALLLLAPLLSLVLYVMIRGLPHFRPSFLFDDLRGITPDEPPSAGGAAHAIVGTLQQAGLALCIVLPLGVLTAVFLNETRSRLRRPVRIVVDAMSGLPSIVAGLFIYSALIINRPFESSVFGYNGLLAALALSLVMMPTVTRTVEVVLRLVPDGLREASLALGASRARTVWSVVLPTARSGVTTAVVLGLARIVGETAPLLFTSFGSSLVNSNPFADPQESLPLFVFRFVKAQSENERTRGYVGAVVLIALVLGLFAIARTVGRDRSRSRRRFRLLRSRR